MREAFDAAAVDGGHVDMGPGNREYVRCLRSVKFDEEGKRRIDQIFGLDCLCSHVLFLENDTGDDTDEMVQWIASHKHVCTI